MSISPSYMPIAHSPANSQRSAKGAVAKDVKRRTKTGCMTCRKRRIKVSLHRDNLVTSATECTLLDPLHLRVGKARLGAAGLWTSKLK